MRPLRPRLRQLARRVRAEEEGFTLVELLSAVLVVSIGVIALLTTFDTSRSLVSFSEAKETIVHAAEQELERLQAIQYDRLALSGTPEDCTPAPCANANQLAYYLGPPGWYRWDQDPTSTEPNPAPRCETGPTGVQPITNCEQLAIDTDSSPGLVPHALTPFQTETRDGGTRLRLEMQRFVTWVDDDCARDTPGAPSALCTGASDHKRITVAVRLVTVSGERRLERGPKRPFVLSTVVRDEGLVL